jgi:CubicO group peptidase (beta-lactamase class C family)
MTRARWWIHAVIGVALLCVTLPTWSSEPTAGLDELVASLLKEGGAPGLALVIVKDDAVIVARGYGTRTLGAQDAVDADTLFGIASLTKAFTATALGILVDRNQIRFDDPLATAMPGFRVADPYVTAHLTLRDALAHRTGTASADLLWYARPNSNPAALIERLGALPQSSSLRERFGYSNLMYIVAGELLARRSGVTWEEFVAKEVLAPLGMTRSSVELSKLAAIPNVATPHIRSGAGIVRVPHDDHRNVGPSGAIYSSANDLGRWLRFLLNDGELDGKRLIKRETLAQTMTPQMLIGPTGPADDLLFPRANVIAYGMGWFVSDYRGHRTSSHTGSIDGMAAFISLLPEQRLGVAVVSNLEGDMARAAIRNWIFDRYLHATDTDWRASYSQWNDAIGAHRAGMAKAQLDSRTTGTRPSLPLARYSGRFVNDQFGEVEVRLGAAGQLEWRLADLPFAPLAHWHYDSFRIQWPTAAMNEPPFSLLSFQPGADGRAARVVVSGPMLAEDAVFDTDDRQSGGQ